MSHVGNNICPLQQTPIQMFFLHFCLLDAMSYNKLNILHWHITDTHSFPLHLENLSQLAEYGAYSPSKIYYKKATICFTIVAICHIIH